MAKRRRWHHMEPATGKQAYFLSTFVSTQPNWQQLRTTGKETSTSSAQLKLEWIIFYQTLGKKNATKTTKHFGIAPKTFYKWLKRFHLQGLRGLEEISRAPLHVRKRQITLTQRIRLKTLRKVYPKYGKMKLVHVYAKKYKEEISSWKIQKIIEENQLYFNKTRASKMRRRQVQARIHQRQRITKLKKEHKVNYLWHVDTVILTLSSGGYRYLLTAIDDVSKLAYARLYTKHSSRNAKDFLARMVYLTERKMINLHHDNGSEFKMEFEEACRILELPQWYSRPHTPLDNAVLERFNRTIQEEFIEITDVDALFVDDFNQKLLEWLIEYNFHRPHKSLDYKTPIEYLDIYYQQLLPMYSSPTKY